MAQSGNARPSHGSRRAWRGNCPGREPPWSRARWPNPSNSGGRPNPRSQTYWRIDAELRYLSGMGRDSDKMFRDGGFGLQARQHPLARGARVRHRFERGEGFGRDDKQCLGGIEIAHRFGKIGAVDIGHEAEGHGALAIVLERFVGHDWPEVRSPNADIDHVADALTGMTFPDTA